MAARDSDIERRAVDSLFVLLIGSLVRVLLVYARRH